FKRILYTYFVRDFNLGSVQLLLSMILLPFGVVFGAYKWWDAYVTHTLASSGTVMLAALPVLAGIQTFTAFLSYEFQNVPKQPLAGRLLPMGRARGVEAAETPGAVPISHLLPSGT